MLDERLEEQGVEGDPRVQVVVIVVNVMAPACDEGSGQGGGDEVVENVLTGSQVSDEGVGQLDGGKG